MSEQFIVAAILASLFCVGVLIARLGSISKSLERIADAAEESAKSVYGINTSVHFLEQNRRG